MSTRAWPYPYKGSGMTMLISADHQMGRRTYTQNHVERAGRDMDRLAPHIDCFIDVGDFIHWGKPQSVGPEDDLAIPWFMSRYAASDKPWMLAFGNHDFSAFSSPYPQRTIADLVRIYKTPAQNYYQDFTDHRLIVINPDRWFDNESKAYGPMILSQTTRDWLDATLAETDKPCWIIAHVCLPQHYSGYMVDNGESAIVAAHPNVAGWISGHRHPDIRTESDTAKVIDVGGHKIYSIIGASSGGLALPVQPAGDPWDNVNASTVFAHLPDDSIEVRFRDHAAERWMETPQGRIVALNRNA